MTEVSRREQRICLKCGFIGVGWWSSENGKHHGFHDKPGTEIECGYLASVLPAAEPTNTGVTMRYGKHAVELLCLDGPLARIRPLEGPMRGLEFDVALDRLKSADIQTVEGEGQR